MQFERDTHLAPIAYYSGNRVPLDITEWPSLEERAHLMSSNPYKTTLTEREAERAIYIDFEGGQGLTPTLMGSLYFEGRKHSDRRRLIIRHDLLGNDLSPLVNVARPKDPYRYDCEAHSLAQAIGGLIRRADNQDRLIVAWSEHEINQIKEAGLPRDLVAAVDRRYRNAKATVRKWGQTHRPDWEFPRDKSGRAHRLINYLDRIGYPVPEEHRGGSVGTSIKSVRAALDSGHNWKQMSVGQQEKWMLLLAHNVCDLDGMRAVTELATHELATGVPVAEWPEWIGVWSDGGVV